MSSIKNRARFKIILVYLLLASPWIGWGTVQTLKPVANSPLDWVDSTFAPRADYDAFCDRFGASDTVVISWPGCRIENAAVDRFVNSLRKLPVFFSNGHWLFERVSSGREIYRALTLSDTRLSDDQARQRLTGSLLGPDGSTTAVIITFNDEGLRQRTQLIPLIRAAATQIGGANYAEQHLAGPIIDGYSVDQASAATITRFAPLSTMVVFCICILCLDSLYVASVVFGVSCISQFLSLAILHYCGGEMTALLVVLPPLIQVLTIAGGIHLVNYAIDAADETNGEIAIDQAVQIGWLPCVLSSGTTAIGLGSLAVSGLAAVREFGIYAALGVLTTLAVLLVLLPGLLAWRPIRSIKQATATRPAKVWDALTRFQTQHAKFVCIGSLLVILGLGVGVSRLQASVRIETLFGPNSRLLHDYAWLEANVGPLVPIEAIVTFPDPKDMTVAEQIETLRHIKRTLGQSPHVTKVSSCLDFLPDKPVPLEGELAEQVLRQIKPVISKAGFLRFYHNQNHWRLTAHVTALGDVDYGSVLLQMRSDLDREMELDSALDFKVRLSGLMPLVHEIQSQLLQDLFASFIAAFLLVTIVMTIVQAGIVAGIASMIPNIFPALALFGFLGWIDHPIDIGSIMTPSVAMGIAVDDKLHFLAFFSRRIDAGFNRTEAVHAAYQHCGRAMIQTTLICGTGLAVFAFSEFVPSAHFAWMMVALLLFAIIGDLIILPAILISPLGIAFEHQVRDH